MTYFKTHWGEMQCVLGEVFVWLINHIYQQAASCIDTGISEGNHSLSKLRSLLYHWQDGSRNRAESPTQEALTTPKPANCCSHGDGPYSSYSLPGLGGRQPKSRRQQRGSSVGDGFDGPENRYRESRNCPELPSWLCSRPGPRLQGNPYLSVSFLYPGRAVSANLQSTLGSHLEKATEHSQITHCYRKATQ